MRPALIVAVLSVSACSFIRTRNPDAPPITAQPVCHDTYGPPVVDSLIGAGGLVGIGLGTYLAVARPVQEDGTSNIPAAAGFIAAGVATAALFAAAAGVGISRIGACREAYAEWDRGQPERERLAAELAASTARARREQLAQMASELLKCPVGELVFEPLSFEPSDPIRRTWAARVEDVRGCSRGVWCGDFTGEGLRCKFTSDYYLARAQLAIETQCPQEAIESQMQQVFTRRSWSAARGETSQITWRLSACGKPYTCTVLGGLAANVSCKVALDSAGAP